MGSLDGPTTFQVPGRNLATSLPWAPWLRRQMAPASTPEAPEMLEPSREGGGGRKSRLCPTVVPTFSPNLGSTRCIVGNSNRDRLGVMMTKCDRWGWEGYSDVSSSGRPGGLPRLPGRRKGGRDVVGRKALRGCLLTLFSYLHSHVLSSDQPASVCQYLLPDTTQRLAHGPHRLLQRHARL